MYYSKIMENDVVNSIDGLAVSLFMSGCPHHCKGCFNIETWNPKNGENIAIYNLLKLLEEKITSYDVHRNFSVLGGEPLAEYNIENTNYIINHIRKKFPDIIIMVWTGYTIEEIEFMDTKSILTNIDYLIEGRFIEKLKDKNLRLRGSSNQRIFKNINGILTDVTDEVQKGNVTI